MAETPYQKAWKRIESSGPCPRRLRNIIVKPFTEFSHQIEQQDPAFVEEITASFYAGDVYVLKNAFPKEFFYKLRKELHQLGLSTPSEFHKMLEGVPNYHRVIDQELTKNYSFESIKHSFYFFPWNSDAFKIFETTYPRWRVIKLLSGLQLNEFEHNTPKDGVIDRLQIAHYPAGSGHIETHSDPYLHQRLIISCIMSKRGIDYATGGVYFINQQDTKVDCEKLLDIGDMQLYYPTVLHGVETVDAGTPVDWNSSAGRWWFGPFSNATDHVEKRHTGFGVKDIAEAKY